MDHKKIKNYDNKLLLLNITHIFLSTMKPIFRMISSS